MGKVLIIEDSVDIRFALSKLIRKEGYNGLDAGTGAEGLEIFKSQIIDLVFLDIGLPDYNGIDMIPMIKNLSSETDIVIITAANDAMTAVSALKAGAVDYLLKPFDLIEFKKVLHMLMKSKFALRQSLLLHEDKGIGSIIGECKGIKRLKEEIMMAAAVRSPVLIEGETGTGKELVARAIYDLSENKNGVFVKVDCGTLSANVMESELFGHERGAFTDAIKDKKGLVEMADGGTLFLDEIGNLPLDLQPKLLRLIEESRFRRVGGLKDIHADLRIIAATNLNIEGSVKKGSFREDLFYRLKVISLTLLPLRDRGNDLLMLAAHFLDMLGRELKKQIKGFTPDAEKILLGYSWPGNIRELRNCMERAVIYCKGLRISVNDLNLKKPSVKDNYGTKELCTLKEMELHHIANVLRSTGNNKTEAARILGISRTTLRDKLKAG